MDLRTHIQTALAHTADHDIGRLFRSALVERDQHDSFLRDQATSVRTDSDLRIALDDVGCAALDATLHLGVRSAPDDAHVIPLAGAHERLLQPGIEHQYRGEYIHH